MKITSNTFLFKFSNRSHCKLWELQEFFLKWYRSQMIQKSSKFLSKIVLLRIKVY